MEAAQEAETDVGLKEAYLPFLRGLQSIKDNTKYADFTIKRNNRCWKVHKAIICPQSEYFSRACNGGYKEAHSNTITLDDDEDAISSMIHFFYHFDYESSSGMHDIRVFIVADKYLIPPLRSIALGRARSWLSMKELGINLPAAIQEIYGLDVVYKDIFKPMLLECIRKHREMFSEPEKYPGFAETLTDIDGFAIEVLKVAAEGHASDVRKYECPCCKTVFTMHTEREGFHCPSCEDQLEDCTPEQWENCEVKD